MSINALILFNLLLLINCYIRYTNGNDVLGCGGFLKSHVQIDFSKVEVKLLTKQGTLKDKTNCAPNGYYFIPLYDKGDYVLQIEPLPGWSFTPTKVNLAVDGKTDLCSQSKDINFVFQGFGITGRVESFGNKLDGPEGVEVILNSDTDIRSTITSAGGLFFFTPVYPGNYKVSISHPKWHILKNSIMVTVSEGNTELPDNSLIVQGYDVTGSIKSDGEPVKGVYVILFKMDNNKHAMKVVGCNHTPLDNIKLSDNYLCYVTTNENGIFSFPSLSNGEYFIQPYFKGQNIHFTPDFQKFTVNHKSVNILQSFEISGFSITGTVLNSANGIPLSNAIIFLNGKEAMKTDVNGKYTFEKMKTGSYNVHVVYDNLEFTEKTFKMNPGMSELPAIYPTTYKVCGKVISESQQEISISQDRLMQQIILKSEPTTGKFCKYLPPGKYEFHVSKLDNGLQFFPISQTIEVTNKPIFDVTFSQLKATVDGEVKCINVRDCDTLKVYLIPTHNDNNEKELTSIVKSGRYQFEDIRPGVYNLKLSENNFCWKDNQFTITINSDKYHAETFQQTGYSVIFASTHNAQVSYENHNKKIVKFDIRKGKTSHCLERIATYQFKFNGCHVYEPDTVEYNPNVESNAISVVTNKHKHTINVRAATNHGDISFLVNNEGVNTKEGPIAFKNGYYTLKLFLSLNENVILTPLSELLYFTPKSNTIKGTDDCNELGVLFEAVKGKVFKGKIIPALSGVLITIESDDFNTLTIETDANGRYKLPPLDADKSYKISASKESYVLTGPDDHGNFLAHKLAEIFVEVLDEDDNKPLQGALLSLSGGESYRSNLQTNEKGKISFRSLSPSKYFLRPMMKEYNFQPTSKIIDVKEGATVNVLLKGKRVAYSAFGQVSSLNGEPEGKMIIIANGIGNCTQYSEEATSESTGQFRIRGLQPYCSYEMRLKGSFDDKEVIERSTPDFIQFLVTNDIYDIKLIVYRPAQNADVLVRVYTVNPEHYKTLRLKVTKESSTSFVVHTTKIDASNLKLTDDNSGLLVHLPSVPLDGNMYSIQIESSLPQYKKEKTTIHSFVSNSSFQFAELTFAVKSNNIEEQIKQTSVWTLIFIFLLLIVIYKIDILTSLLSNKISNINLDMNSFRSKPINNEVNDNMDIDKIVQSINATKRKPKPRKI